MTTLDDGWLAFEYKTGRHVCGLEAWRRVAQ